MCRGLECMYVPAFAYTRAVQTHCVWPRVWPIEWRTRGQVRALALDSFESPTSVRTNKSVTLWRYLTALDKISFPCGPF
jgi:hypothetical protein